MASKACSRCNLIKSVNDFNHDSYSNDGFQHKCKLCNVEVVRIWRNNNCDHVREQKRNYYANNPSARIGNNIHQILKNILRRGCYSTRTEQIIGLNKTTYLEWLS